MPKIFLQEVANSTNVMTSPAKIGVGDGVKLTDPLWVLPGTQTNEMVWVGGVIQERGVGYTVSSGVLTFTEAPPSGAEIVVSCPTYGMPAGTDAASVGGFAASALEKVANKNVANGYAGLDSSGKISSSNLSGGVVTGTWWVQTTTQFDSTSTSFVDVTGVSQSITTQGGDLIVHATGGGFGTGNSGQAAIAAINVDGTDYPVCYVKGYSTGPSYGALSGSVKVTGLAAGTHTVKLRGRVSAIGGVTFSLGGVQSALLIMEVK